MTDGQVQVENGSSSLLLSPGSSVRLKERAREKDDEQSLRFEMAWSRDEQPVPTNGLRFTAPSGTTNGKRSRTKKTS